ncbi:AAA family ATPase [Streptomyces sp. Rer75]|uniref:AAA family ATPase n=1 Tax=Streptomyces sp. Rer75 TaxID=2750011 RepID=UPI0015D0B415|nr:AAA family ATPase [Streptomyces sp. Rer75]QLH19298.1 AAA family ATPase [Streptomyces sp. Rer75]
MQLTQVRSRLYRNIVDSGDVDIAPDVTALVGKNESGKTALLSAIYRFHPVYPEHSFALGQDYPRWRKVKDTRSGQIKDAVPITCTFTLDDDDLKAVADVLGPDVVKGRSYSRSIPYEGNHSVDLLVDEGAALENLYNDEEVPPALRSVLGSRSLAAALEQADGLQAAEDSDAADLDLFIRAARHRLADHKSAWQRAVRILRDREPKFFYFSNYQNLPGRIALTDLNGQEEQPGASPMQTARALLELASTTAGALSVEDFEERKAELEAVSNDITQQVFEYWKQNPDLSVEIDLDKTTVQHPQGQQAIASHLDIRVKDRRHGFTNNFSARSTGFQWFFSFLAAFSEFENYPHGVVVLLDEPGLSLHGRAQADFLRFINERLAPQAQVIYTTHSPFMVETAHLDRIRIVEDRGPDIGAVVTKEVLSVTDDSLFPLQAALGYDIAQNLFVGPDNLLVEGTSDYTYLTLISDFLKEAGRTHLDERWRILPAGGATNIPAFVALIGTNLQATVLIDSTPAGVTKLKALTNKGLLSPKRLLLTDTFTDGVKDSDIEDLFSPGDYLKLYNAAFGTKLKVSDLNGTDRIIARIGRASGAPFIEHGRPADALLRKRDTLLPGLSETTLSRFEHLFTAVNETLA